MRNGKTSNFRNKIIHIDFQYQVNFIFLYEAAASSDLETLKILVLEDLDIINEADQYGNPPLIYAIRAKSEECVKFLIENGASPLITSGDGWPAISEAVFTLNPQIVCSILNSMSKTFIDIYTTKLNDIIDALEDIPDFELQIKWKIKSWIPIIGMFLPDDTITIKKWGSSARLSATLVDFQNGKWIRGNHYVIFRGRNTEECGTIYAMSHQGDLEVNSIIPKEEEIENNLNEITPEMYQCTSLFNSPQFTIRTITDSINICNVRGWNMKIKKENICGVKTKAYRISNLKLEILTMKRDIEDTELWNLNTFKRTLNVGFSATCEEFPLSIDTLVQLLDVLGRQAFHIKKLKEALENLFKKSEQEYGFPVRIEFPIIPGFNAIAKFIKFEFCEQNPSDFEVDLSDTSIYHSYHNTITNEYRYFQYPVQEEFQYPVQETNYNYPVQETNYNDPVQEEESSIESLDYDPFQPQTKEVKENLGLDSQIFW